MTNKCEIIVIGGSAGAVEALTNLVRELPDKLDATIFIVIHLSPYVKSFMPEILAKNTKLNVCHAKNGERFEKGHIYLAPPDQHMLINADCIELSRGPRVNRSRPSIDSLFRTAAYSHGSNVMGVLLTGLLDDGTAGLLTIHRYGGMTIVQDPAEAAYPDMPLNAQSNVTIDYSLSISGIANLIRNLASLTTNHVNNGLTNTLEFKIDKDGGQMSDKELNEIGLPASFSCPECHGTLWEIRDEEIHRYRCRVGHAYGAESLSIAQIESVDAALWEALRALKEKSNLAYRMAERAQMRNDPTSERFYERARDSEQHAELIKTVLYSYVRT